jgi:transcriptional regulator with XRE-family HTH domain
MTQRSTEDGKDREEINARMMQVIREQGLTQADCVRATGATSPTVNDWFNKGAVPDAATLGRVAHATRMNCHWLITGHGPRGAPGHGNTPAAVSTRQGHKEAVAMIEKAVDRIKKELEID